MPAKKDKVAVLKSVALSGEVTDSIVNAGTVIENLPSGVLVCAKGKSNQIQVLLANDFARNLLGIKGQGKKFPLYLDDIWHGDESFLLGNQILNVFRTELALHFEWTQRSGAVERFLSAQLLPLKNAEGNIYQVICTIEDQTAEKLAEKNLLHHAFHDALTGLPNRIMFRSKLEEAVTATSNINDSGCAVLVINIDRFQQINDSFGHSAGDRFLVSMASTLRRCIRGSDLLARLSGDEFAVLVSYCNDIEEIDMISSRIHQAMRHPYDLDGNEIYSSVSVGVATTLEVSCHPEDLIRNAEFAMHRAKLDGKAKSETYKEESHTQARSQFHLETELRRAVERNELELRYQPIIDLKTQKLLGFESLTRWVHKERGFVSPNEFIPLAEETGIILDLGNWAIQTCCKQIKQWQGIFGDKFDATVNVNVSGIQFARDNVVKLVSDALTQHGVEGKYLKVELTESAIMTNIGRISAMLEKIRELGVQVALDDFGTGYSSLNYLHQFPLDIIKIDRSFIAKMEVDNEQYEILKMIAMLAKSLKLDIVCEGLEDQVHIDMLVALGYSVGQGFYFSKAVPAREAEAMLAGDLPWIKS